MSEKKRKRTSPYESGLWSGVGHVSYEDLCKADDAFAAAMAKAGVEKRVNTEASTSVRTPVHPTTSVGIQSNAGGWN